MFDSISTREAFGKALAEAADVYDNLFYVAADTLKSVGGGPMRSRHPSRAIDIGIAEQTMALMGAGLASCGARVVIASYGTFCSMRIAEQVRSFICYPNLDVKIVAGLGGLSGGQEGVTHQSVEDIGVLRSMANLSIVEVADAASTEVITAAVLAHRGPVYLRLGRGPSATVFDASYRFELGKANIMKATGSDAAILTTGLATRRAQLAERELARRGYDVQLIEVPTIKPIDRAAVLNAAADTGCLVTVEDHNVIGGLGSAVAEVLADELPTPLRRIGLLDEYAETGDHEELMDKYHLHPQSIADAVIDAASAKTSRKRS